MAAVTTDKKSSRMATVEKSGSEGGTTHVNKPRLTTPIHVFVTNFVNTHHRTKDLTRMQNKRASHGVITLFPDHI